MKASRKLRAGAGKFPPVTCGTVYLRPSQIILHVPVLQCTLGFFKEFLLPLLELPHPQPPIMAMRNYDDLMGSLGVTFVTFVGGYNEEHPNTVTNYWKQNGKLAPTNFSRHCNVLRSTFAGVRVSFDTSFQKTSTKITSTNAFCILGTFDSLELWSEVQSLKSFLSHPVRKMNCLVRPWYWHISRWF